MQEQQKIQMVDLHGQYMRIKAEVDAAVAEVIDSSAFINGPAVGRFASALAQYTGAAHVIPCGNGTDALQIALMALGLKPGDEVIVPAFTYVASAEVIALLGLRPVLVDVDRETFNTDIRFIERALTPRTRAVIPVHLFGQSCDMAPILDFAAAHGLYVVEDNAQSLGAVYTFPDGRRRHTGTLGHIGCTSFFPSKNLGCYGDGGALFTDDPALAERIRMTANHGQRVKYHHDVVGCNSRLDTLQAAVLEVKLRHLDEYCTARWEAAARYRALLSGTEGIELPAETSYSTHVYHQFTLKVAGGRRDALKEHLASRGIPSMIYYPLPLHHQQAYRQEGLSLPAAEDLAQSVLSLPMHTELTAGVQERIAEAVKDFSGNRTMEEKGYFAHETAVIDPGCTIGEGCRIWHFSHIMTGAVLGPGCNIGQNVVISPEVVLGRNVKVQNNVSVYTGVTCGDDVFLGPSCVFTNVVNPRSAVNRRGEYLRTHVGQGATIGANATVVCGHDIGEWAFIGAGAVVTKDVPPYALVVGNPSRQVGWMSRAGYRLEFGADGTAVCPGTGERYRLRDGKVTLEQ